MLGDLKAGLAVVLLIAGGAAVAWLVQQTVERSGLLALVAFLAGFGLLFAGLSALFRWLP